MINDAGVALIKRWEGCKLEAYPDPGTGKEPFTIGWGHTRGVLPGMKWTQLQADYVLKSDIEEFSGYVKNICKIFKFYPNPNQFAALTSYCYNCGPGGLRHLFTRSATGESDYISPINLANNLCKDVNESTAIKTGIMARRAAERALFMTPIQ